MTVDPTDSEFARELRTLKDRLSTMAGRAAEQIAKAMEALTTQDDALARQVIAADQAIEVTEFAADYRPLGWKPIASPE